MRFLIALFFLIPLQALSLKDFDAKSPAEQSAYVVNFIDRMASDLGEKNPQLRDGIREYFSHTAAGKKLPEGVERLYVELGAVEIQAKEGRADLSRIQLESIIVWVVKQYVCPSKCTVDRPR
jgi:hypothetical protein